MNLSTIVQDSRFQIAAVGIGGFITGTTAGYLIGRRAERNKDADLKVQYEEESDWDTFQEFDEEEPTEYASVGPLTLDDSPEVLTPDEVVDRVLSPEDIPEEMLEGDSQEKTDGDNEYVDYSAVEPTSDISEVDGDASEEEDSLESTEDVVEEDAQELVNVFAGADGEWDQEEEDAKREASDDPYIIHQQEWAENEFGYTQQTLTFYNKDNTLADENDAPIYGHTKLVGPLRFGHGSNDPSVVYVRNVRRRAEFEIFLYEGSFAHEVLGQQHQDEMEADLQHSEPRRFRTRD